MLGLFRLVFCVIRSAFSLSPYEDINHVLRKDLRTAKYLLKRRKYTGDINAEDDKSGWHTGKPLNDYPIRYAFRNGDPELVSLLIYLEAKIRRALAE